MPITTTDSMLKGSSLSGKTRCWGCLEHSSAFRISPIDGNVYCASCCAKMGLDLPLEESDEPVGTISESPKDARKA